MTDPAAETRTGPPLPHSGVDLSQRYGRQAVRRRRSGFVVAVVLVAVGGPLLAWFATAYSLPPVTSNLTSFTVVSDTRVEVRFEVDRRRSVPVSCRVQAQAFDFSVVGESITQLPAGKGSQEVSAVLVTQRRATAAVVEGCTAPGMTQPR